MLVPCCRDAIEGKADFWPSSGGFGSTGDWSSSSRKLAAISGHPWTVFLEPCEKQDWIQTQARRDFINTEESA